MAEPKGRYSWVVKLAATPVKKSVAMKLNYSTAGVVVWSCGDPPHTKSRGVEHAEHHRGRRGVVLICCYDAARFAFLASLSVMPSFSLPRESPPSLMLILLFWWESRYVTVHGNAGIAAA